MLASFDRRQALALAPALLAAACSRNGNPADMTPAQRLQTLVDAPALSRAPAAGIVLIQNGEIIASDAVGFAQGLSSEEAQSDIEPALFTIDQPFRAASISKLAVALLCARLSVAGVIDLDADIRNWGVSLPSSPVIDEATLTPRALLAHLSGLEDPDAYWNAHPGTLYELLIEQPPTSSSGTSGWFHYCNLNYGILATALEHRTGRRFDTLIQEHVIGPMGLDAGFNWAGASLSKRRTAATLYRETEEGWAIQIDGPNVKFGSNPMLLLEAGADQIPYTPGQNGTLFSPQGGLRASLADLAKLVDVVAREPVLIDPVWTANSDMSNGDTDAGYFTGYGSGVHLYDKASSFWPDVELAGHHGEAYGLYAGAWHAPALDLSFAYAVTGTPEDGPGEADHPALNGFTSPLVDAVRDAYMESAAST